MGFFWVRFTNLDDRYIYHHGSVHKGVSPPAGLSPPPTTLSTHRVSRGVACVLDLFHGGLIVCAPMWRTDGWGEGKDWRRAEVFLILVICWKARKGGHTPPARRLLSPCVPVCPAGVSGQKGKMYKKLLSTLSPSRRRVWCSHGLFFQQGPGDLTTRQISTSFPHILFFHLSENLPTHCTAAGCVYGLL